MGQESETTGRVDRLIRWVELTAAGFLAAVTAITFVSVFLRYLFSSSIPDAYDICSLLLGILIFWGIAAASYRGEHITVDLIWSMAPPRMQRALDIFAGVLSLACMAILAWMVGTKVIGTLNDNVRTFDLRMPVWSFFLVAWIGLAAAVVMIAIRLVRLLTGPLRARHE